VVAMGCVVSWDVFVDMSGGEERQRDSKKKGEDLTKTKEKRWKLKAKEWQESESINGGRGCG
jgi:hypothetical protein